VWKMNKDNGGPAFPVENFTKPDGDICWGDNGMTLRDWFATWHNPSDGDIEREQSNDRARNPYNDYHKPKLRDRQEIICDLKFKHADAMLKARES